MSNQLDDRVLLLDAEDNIVIARTYLQDGTKLQFGRSDIRLRGDAPIGFKIARWKIAKGAVVYKYGAPIGSSLSAIDAGEVIHLHNMKSDYIPTYTPGGVGFTSREEVE